MVACGTLQELKSAVATCGDLDDLVALLNQGDNLAIIGNRPEVEANISWIPTYGGDNAGDGGEGWEVISWDSGRVATMRRLYGEANDFELSVRDRP